jgi:glutaredoxin 3
MQIIVYSTNTCPICDKTKDLLDKWDLEYEFKKVDEDRDALVQMAKITNGARTVPQIVIDNKWIGGFSELTELHMEGFFDK